MNKIQFLELHGWKRTNPVKLGQWLMMDCGTFTDIININVALCMDWDELHELIGY